MKIRTLHDAHRVIEELRAAHRDAVVLIADYRRWRNRWRRIARRIAGDLADELGVDVEDVWRRALREDVIAELAIRQERDEVRNG